MVDRAAPVTRQTVAKGTCISALTSAASAAGSTPPFFGHFLPDLILECQLADLALGLADAAVIGRAGGPSLQGLLATVQELVTPSGEAMGFDAQLPGEFFELLAPKQAQDDVHLPTGRPPRLGAGVPGSLTVHRHECHLGPPLFSVQLNRVRASRHLSGPSWLSGQRDIDVRRLRCVDHAGDLQFDPRREHIEESASMTQNDRDLVHHQLVQDTGPKGSLCCVRARARAHRGRRRRPPPASSRWRCRRDICHRRRVGDGRSRRSVTGHEDRNAVMITAPVIDLLDGPASRQDCARLHHLVP